jgi:hypothetical protein
MSCQASLTGGRLDVEDDFGIQRKLADIILELYDVLCLQEHGCRVLDLEDHDSRNAVTDRAQFVLNSWHELHEFNEEAYANSDLVRTLLIMYSDTIATYHEVCNSDPLPIFTVSGRMM